MQKIPGFETLFEPRLMEEIGQYGTARRFKEGEIVMDYGKYVRMMPIVLEGTIKVLRLDENGKEILLYYLTSSESCSMAYSCCLEARKSEVRAIAETDTEIIAIPHEKLDEWLCKYPTWKSYIMQSFNLRFMELLKSFDSLAFHKLDERLVRYLKDKQRMGGSTLIKMSHAQIADEMGTSRVVISRLLKQLENDNCILLYRNEIKIMPGLDNALKDI
jgi:CRP/FNR family transcriptional regulator